MKSGPKNPNSFHLSGIVPVHGQETDFKFPWPPCLMPLDNDYSLVHRSIVECAYAGCETIWVVCNDDIAPIIKTQVGDYIHDPKYYYRRANPKPTDEQKMIPIYFVPIHPNDRNRRDCLGWAALYGAYSAYLTARGFSEWLLPDKYFVSFPYGVYDPSIVDKYRSKISSKNNFYLTHEGKSVKNDKYLSFTFDPKDFIECRKDFRDKANLLYIKGNVESGFQKEKLPIGERYPGRYFKLSQVFEKLDLSEANSGVVQYYNTVITWDQYRDYFRGPDLVSNPNARWFERNRYRKSLLYLNEFKEE